MDDVCLYVRIWKLTTGMTWVTPSPLSMTVPVSVLSPTCLDVQEAARASTACRTQKRDVDHTLFSSAVPEDGVQRAGRESWRESDDRRPHLHGDVEPRHIKGLEHDLGCVLSVFWCVQRRLCLKNIQEQISSDAQLRNICFPRGEERNTSALTRRK